MRRKKHKHTRRSMAFYKINFGFREPFKARRAAARTPARSLAARRGQKLSGRQRPRNALAAQSPVPAPDRPVQVLLDGNFLHATLAAK
jgi:hypothetical protein